jgi:hypothetical protein
LLFEGLVSLGNWDVEELKARAEEIKGSDVLGFGLLDLPDKAVDA